MAAVGIHTRLFLACIGLFGVNTGLFQGVIFGVPLYVRLFRACLESVYRAFLSVRRALFTVHSDTWSVYRAADKPTGCLSLFRDTPCSCF